MNTEEAILSDIQDEYINIDELKAREEWESYSFKGLPVPRVSSVLKACSFSIEPLMRWASRLGYRHMDYVIARNTAAEKGTRIHNAIEAFIKDKKVPNYRKIPSEEIKNAVYNGFEGFASFWNAYRFKDMITNATMEKTLVTPYFGGTYDLMITLNDGRNLLYDFKTSNNLKWEHFVQLSAYKYALENYYNTPISGIGVLLINKYKPNCNEYFIDTENASNIVYINKCQKCFISMLYSYYNSLSVMEYFDTIKKECLIKNK